MRKELAQGRLPPQQPAILGAAYQVRLEYLGTTAVRLGKSANGRGPVPDIDQGSRVGSHGGVVLRARCGPHARDDEDPFIARDLYRRIDSLKHAGSLLFSSAAGQERHRRLFGGAAGTPEAARSRWTRSLRSPASFDASRYDICVYQLGNNPYHDFVYEAAMKHPGVVVMHEANLHHLIADLTINRNDWDGYVREVGRNHGPEAQEYAERSCGRCSGLRITACR